MSIVLLRNIYSYRNAQNEYDSLWLEVFTLGNNSEGSKLPTLIDLLSLQHQIYFLDTCLQIEIQWAK